MEPQNKRSKTLTKVILGVTVLLAIISLGTAYYFYQIQDISPTDTSATNGCGCYFILADSNLSSCSVAKPENAFEFKTGSITEDGQCSATCDPRTAAPIMSSEATPTILGCTVTDFPAIPGCIDVAVVNADNERLPEALSPDDSITIKATFAAPSTVSNTEDDLYSGFSFAINGEKIEVDLAGAEVTGIGGDKKYTVSTQVSDFKNADKLTIQAFGTSITNTEVTSAACLRTVSIMQEKVASCTAIDVNLSNDTQPKVEDLWLDVSLAQVPQSLAVKFTIGGNDTVLTTKDVSEKLIDGTIILDQEFLYNSDNFTSTNNFSVLDSEQNKYDISSVVIVDGVEIESEACKASETLPDRTPTDVDPDPDPTDEDPDDEDPDTDPTDEDPETPVTSTFVTSKTASKQCVERVSPNNSVEFTVEVDNNDSTAQNIVSIKDKLPLGFTYTTGSTDIDGVATPDSGLVTITTVGSTQEIVWEKTGGWTIPAGQALTITFNATANSAALSGSNLNEVVVTPQNTPADSTTLRASVSLQVAQSCTAPQTALFDSNVAKGILGLLVIVLAAVFYKSQYSYKYSDKLVSSDVYQGIKLFGLKITEPRKYFEEKSLHTLEKKRKKSN